MRGQPWIGVIGPGGPDPEGRYDIDVLARLAEEVGRLLAARGAVVLTGGLGGVMAAAARGATRDPAGRGECWGILPSADPTTGNAYLTRRIATGIGEARDFVLVAMSEALVAVGENPGTRIEIGFAQKQGRTVVGLASRPDERIAGTTPATNPDEAVRLALAATGRQAGG
jgi:hypothetical protein